MREGGKRLPLVRAAGRYLADGVGQESDRADDRADSGDEADAEGHEGFLHGLPPIVDVMCVNRVLSL